MTAGLTVKAPLLSVLSGILLVVSFPNFGVHVLAWVALVPLLLALEGKRPTQAYLLSCAAGIVFFLGACYSIWAIRAFKLVDGAVVSLYLAQYVAFWGLGISWVRRRTTLPLALIAPPLWIVLEYVRCHAGFLSLPWVLLGDSQYRSLALIQISSFTGVYGLSFLIVLVNAALTEAILEGRRRLAESSRSFPSWTAIRPSTVVAAFLLSGAFVHGVVVLAHRPTADTTRIALIQGNIPQDRKWDRAYRQATLETYAGLTREAARHRPDLIVWPETAVPGDVLHDGRLRREVSRVAVETRTHLLVGTSEHAKFTKEEFRGKHYNSMVLFAPDGEIAGEYRKIALVPFGEYEPLQGLIEWPRALVANIGAFVPGEDYTVFAVGPVIFGATICWENIFPDLFREFAKRGVGLMINATNEAWFGETAAPRQFLAMSVIRAAEHRIAIARATNTGVSAFIDPSGRITNRLTSPGGKELFVAGVLVGEMPLTTTRTFYTRYGDVFTASLSILAALLLLAAAVPARARLRFVRLLPSLSHRLRPAT